MDDDSGCVVAAVLVVGVLAFIGGCSLGKTEYHDLLCLERYRHAATAADSLVIVQADRHCANDYVLKETPNG